MADKKLLAQAWQYQRAQSERSRCDTRRERFAWLHIPKTGSSFATALFHAANLSLPPSARLPTCTRDGFMLTAEVTWRNASARSLCRRVLRRGNELATACELVPTERCRGGQAELAFLERFPLDAWFRCRFWEHEDGNIGSHSAIVDSEIYERYKGKWVGMFRSPASRVTSAFLWFVSSFPEHARPNASSYARRVLGTATRMIAGQRDGLSCSSAFGGLPTRPADRSVEGRRAPSTCGDDQASPDVALAIHRLQHGFAFVGLTEYWALSICLFHAIFGGRCHAVEFDNARPSGNTAGFWRRRQLAETTAAVAAVNDPHDEAVYAEARRLFARAVRRHQLSAFRCWALCPEAPPHSHFNPPTSWSPSTATST